jgi:hypothetical protein
MRVHLLIYLPTGGGVKFNVMPGWKSTNIYITLHLRPRSREEDDCIAISTALSHD